MPSVELPELVREVVASLMDVSDDDQNRIWVAMATDLVAALIIAYARTGKPYTNADVRAMADSLTTERMRVDPRAAPRPSRRRAVHRKGRLDPTTSVMIFVQQALRQIFAGGFRRPGDFSARRFVREKAGRALFLEFDVAFGETATPVFRTVLDLVLKESLGRDRRAGRVFVVLDEFSLLPRVAHLDAGPELRPLARPSVRGGHSERRPGPRRLRVRSEG